MRVWVLDHHSYGETYVFDESTNLLSVPIVKSELEALEGNYDDEVEAFKDDVAAGRGGYIEERFSVYLEDVKHYD